MDNLKERYQITITGAERSGKSYLSKIIAKTYVKKNNSCLIYNIGRLTDFPDSDFTLFEPLTFLEHEEYMTSDFELEKYRGNPSIFLFRYNGKVYDFENFNDIFKGKCIKMFRVISRKEENAFFYAIYKYVSNCLIVFDDCKPLFAYGLKEHHLLLFSRKNHTGIESKNEQSRGKGVDIITIFHDVDTVTNDIWLYTTDLYMFLQPMQVNGKTIKNDQLLQTVKAVFQLLSKSPKYTCFAIGFKGENYNKVKKIIISQ